MDDFKILGRTIGTYSGWDRSNTFEIQVYDFKPIPGVDLPEQESITFDLETGLATWFTRGPNDKSDVWSVIHEVDFIPLIIHLERDK